jgi:hypothetical protein
MQIYQRPADGSRPQQAVIATQTDGVATDVSSDGKWLLYEEESDAAPGYGALKALPLTGGTKLLPVLDRVDWQSNARLMPVSNDWLAYQSSEAGSTEVYLTHFPSGGAKYQVSLEGGNAIGMERGRQAPLLSRRQAEVDQRRSAGQQGFRKRGCT